MIRPPKWFVVIRNAITQEADARRQERLYDPDKAHPNPDVEEFAIWLERAEFRAPLWLGEMDRWRHIAEQAANADFLRYVDPAPQVTTRSPSLKWRDR